MNKTQTRIPVGISSCLLGDEVRFDGSHRRKKELIRWFGAYFDFVGLCPEIASGMGVPREPIRLVQGVDGVRMITSRTQQDWTEQMVAASRPIIRSLKRKDISGLIVKKDSPSCGMERVRLYQTEKNHTRTETGIFIREFKKVLPNVPIEEEGRLLDRNLRRHFVVRVFAFQRWKELRSSGSTRRNLMNFHGENKFLLMAHDPHGQKCLGRLVAHGNKVPCKKLYDSYETIFMESLGKRRTTGRDVNVLKHVLGHLRGNSDSREYGHALGAIEEFENGLTPLEAPLTVLRSMVSRGKDQ